MRRIVEQAHAENTVRGGKQRTRITAPLAAMIRKVSHRARHPVRNPLVKGIRIAERECGSDASEMKAAFPRGGFHFRGGKRMRRSAIWP